MSLTGHNQSQDGETALPGPGSWFRVGFSMLEQLTMWRATERHLGADDLRNLLRMGVAVRALAVLDEITKARSRLAQYPAVIAMKTFARSISWETAY